MFIGRKEEIKICKEVLVSPKAEMIAVIGRRRVGKTFLIRSVYEEEIIFEHYAQQLEARVRLFQRLSKTKCQVRMTMITSFGLKNHRYSLGVVDRTLELGDLF